MVKGKKISSVVTCAFLSDRAVIDLAPLQSKLGQAWIQYGPSVHRIASRIINQEIWGTGTYFRQGDSYELIFEGMSARRSRRECRKIADKLEKILLGAKEPNYLPLKPLARRRFGTDTRRGLWTRIKAAIGVVGQSLALSSRRAGQALNTRSSAQNESEIAYKNKPRVTPLASTTGGHEGEPSVEPSFNKPPGSQVFEPTSGSFRVPLQRSRSATSAASSSRIHQVQQNSPPLPESTPSTGTQSLAKSSELRERDLEEVPRAADGAGGAHDRPMSDIAKRAMERAVEDISKRQERQLGTNSIYPPADLRVEFHPFWNLKSNRLTTYGIVPISNWCGELCAGYASMLPRGFTNDETLALDKLLLHESVAALGSRNQPECLALAVTSLHAMTLQHASAASEYIEQCKSIPEPLRSRLLFEIVDVDRLIGSAEGRERILSLSKLARGVLGRSSVKATNLSSLKVIRLLAVGFDLTADMREEVVLIKDLETFAVVAERSRLVSYARGLNTVSLTVAAVGAGFGYIEGIPLSRSGQNEGLKILPFRMNDLFGSPLAS